MFHWVVTPCTRVGRYPESGVSTGSDMLTTVYEATRLQGPEDLNRGLRGRENFKSPLSLLSSSEFEGQLNLTRSLIKYAVFV